MTTQKIHLTRVLPGYYSWNSSDYKTSASVIRDNPSDLFWTVTVTTTEGTHEATAETLQQARSFIASI